MKKVMLVLNRRLLGDSLLNALGQQPQIEPFAEFDYTAAFVTASARRPDTVLIEVPENGSPQTAAECGDAVREASPGCRVVLLCPENDSACVRWVIGARRSGVCDDFLFYDASLQYMVCVLEAV